MKKPKKQLNLTKQDVVDYASDITGFLPADVRTVVNLTLDCIAQGLCDNRRIVFRKWGTFQPVQRKAKIGRNPSKPEVTFNIPASINVKFRASPELVDSINNR